MPSTSFSGIIVLAKTSNTMWNKSGESGHTYLVPDLKRKAFSFSSLRGMMLAVGLFFFFFFLVLFFWCF